LGGNSFFVMLSIIFDMGIFFLSYTFFLFAKKEYKILTP
jgi:hypothetical protein